MKTKVIFSNLFLALTLLFFVASAPATGQTQKEVRKVKTFTEIELEIPAKVFVSQGATQKVEVKAPASVLPNVVLEVKDSELIIKKKRGSDIEDVTIYITAKQIEELSIAGAGSIVAQTGLKAKEMELEIAGSGSIEVLTIDAKKLEAEISGTGKIKIGGGTVSEKFSAEISGVAKIQASQLKAKKAEVEISGSGACYVHVQEKLDVEISGVGKVYYSGDALIDSDISGMGKVVKQ